MSVYLFVYFWLLCLNSCLHSVVIVVIVGRGRAKKMAALSHLVGWLVGMLVSLVERIPLLLIRLIDTLIH